MTIIFATIGSLSASTNNMDTKHPNALSNGLYATLDEATTYKKYLENIRDIPEHMKTSDIVKHQAMILNIIRKINSGTHIFDEDIQNQAKEHAISYGQIRNQHEYEA